MADYGLRVLNASLDIQIDGSYRNNSLFKTKGVARSGSGNNLNATFNTITTRPVISHKLLTATPLNLYRSYKSGSDYIGCSFVFPWGSAFTVDFQVFQQGITTNATYGLIVKNASGLSVFSSADKHFTIKGAYTATLGHGNSTASVDITVKDADNNYFLLDPFVIKNEIPGNPAETRHQFRGMRKVDSTTVRIINFFDEYAPGGPPSAAWVASLTLLEVRKE